MIQKMTILAVSAIIFFSPLFSFSQESTPIFRRFSTAPFDKFGHLSLQINRQSQPARYAYTYDSNVGQACVVVHSALTGTTNAKVSSSCYEASQEPNFTFKTDVEQTRLIPRRDENNQLRDDWTLPYNHYTGPAEYLEAHNLPGAWADNKNYFDYITFIDLGNRAVCVASRFCEGEGHGNYDVKVSCTNVTPKTATTGDGERVTLPRKESPLLDHQVLTRYFPHNQTTPQNSLMKLTTHYLTDRLTFMCVVQHLILNRVSEPHPRLFLVGDTTDIFCYDIDIQIDQNILFPSPREIFNYSPYIGLMDNAGVFDLYVPDHQLYCLTNIVYKHVRLDATLDGRFYPSKSLEMTCHRKRPAPASRVQSAEGSKQKED